MIVLKNILNMVTHFVMFSFSFKHHTSKKNFEHIFVVLLMCFETSCSYFVMGTKGNIAKKVVNEASSYNLTKRMKRDK
jgi:hypothetical protein